VGAQIDRRVLAVAVDIDGLVGEPGLAGIVLVGDPVTVEVGALDIATAHYEHHDRERTHRRQRITR